MKTAPSPKRLIALSFIALCAAAPSANAAAVAYVTQTGKGDMGNPQAFGGADNTGQSVAFELTIDFTPAVDTPTAPINLWEAGATGSGSGLVLEGDDLHFFAGNSPTHFITGSHGLTATQNNVQIVSVFEIGAGAAAETLSLYVNGSQIATGSFVTANIWAGSDAGGLGQLAGGAGARWSNIASPANNPFDPTTVINFPTGPSTELAIYRLASSGGSVDNTLENILVPEPSSFAMLGLAGAALILRRRR